MSKQSDANPAFRHIMPYAVALVGVKLRPDGKYDVIHCGSGCLLEVGGILGVLTAGHVVKELEEGRFFKWGLVSFTGIGERSALVSFPADHVACIRRGDDYKNRLPDIGFIRLPSNIAQSLDRPFFSVTTRYVRLVRHRIEPEQATLRVLLGMVGERSEIVEHFDDGTEITTLMLVAPAELINQAELEDGYDYDEYRLRNMHHIDPIQSYQGVSGGPIFAYSESNSADSRWIAGVAIRQSNVAPDGSRTILAHGIASIYGAAIAMIGEAFPEMIQASDLPDQ